MEVKEGKGGKDDEGNRRDSKAAEAEVKEEKDCCGYIMCIWMSYNAYSNLTRYIFINHSK